MTAPVIFQRPGEVLVVFVDGPLGGQSRLLPDGIFDEGVVKLTIADPEAPLVDGGVHVYEVAPIPALVYRGTERWNKLEDST